MTFFFSPSFNQQQNSEFGPSEVCVFGGGGQTFVSVHPVFIYQYYDIVGSDKWRYREIK